MVKSQISLSGVHEYHPHMSYHDLLNRHLYRKMLTILVDMSQDQTDTGVHFEVQLTAHFLRKIVAKLERSLRSALQNKVPAIEPPYTMVATTNNKTKAI